MTRTEKRQEKRAQEQELKRKALEAQGFTVSTQVYREKRNLANRKCGYNTPEDEKLDRQVSAEAALKVYRRMLPILLKRLNKIKDPRQPKKVKHSLIVLMIYGILMFVYQRSSLRNANKEMSTAIFFENMRAMFPDFETMPHADTLSRLLEKIQVEEIEESMLELFEQLVKTKKFRNYLIHKRYVIAINGTQKFMRTEKWSEECLERHVGKDKQGQYYVIILKKNKEKTSFSAKVSVKRFNCSSNYVIYVLEAVVVLDQGITLPLMSEFLSNESYREVSSQKQDCERKAFYRFAQRIKQRFSKLKILVT